MNDIRDAVDWQPTLTGPSLLLRPLVEADCDPLYLAASDPLIWEQHPDKLRYTHEGFQAYFRSGIESKGALAVINRQSGEIIGSSRFRDHKPGDLSVEIGYTFLTRKYWGGRHNNELKRLMLDHAFQFVDTVFFMVGPENHRSRKALLKIGAVEIEATSARPCDVDARCSVIYKMTKASWRTLH